METKVLKTILVVSLLIITMFVGLIGFDDDIIIDRASGSNIYYVYPGATGPGNYTKIQDAINASSNGDTIRVFEGWYNENLIVNRSVSIIGNTTFGNGSNFTIINANGIGDGLYISADNVSIEGLLLYSSGTGINDSGIEMNNVSNCTIRYNLFINNSIGLWLNNTYNNTIEQNYFIDNNISIGADQSNADYLNNNSLSNSTTFDVRVKQGDLTVINSNLNESKLDASGSGKLIVKYYHYIMVASAFSQGGPGISDASVQIMENGTNKIIFDGISNQEGFIAWVPLTAFSYNGSFNYSVQNMTFNASKKGYINGSNVTNASSENQFIIIMLGDDDVPVVYNFEMAPVENLSANNPCHAQATANETGDAFFMFIALTYVGGNQTQDNYTDAVMIREDVIVDNREENIYDLNYTWYANSPMIEDEGMGCYLYDSVNKTFLYANLWEENNTNISGIEIYFSNSTYTNMEGELQYWTSNETIIGLLLPNLGPNGMMIDPSNFAQLGANITPRVEIISFDKTTGDLAGPPMGNYQSYGPTYELTDVKFRGEPLLPDGGYKAGLVAVDYGWNIGYNFTDVTVDNTVPKIKLLSPADNAVITPGTDIELSVTDTFLLNVTRSIDSGLPVDLSAPFKISTTLWSDDSHSVQIYANDSANNSASKVFNFIIDSIEPEIILNSPADNTVVVPGTEINLSILETNIDFVNYTVNGTSNTTLAPPYNIDTSTWLDGEYVIDVYVTDLAGLTNTSSFTFTIDSLLPSINLISPVNNTVVTPGTNITLDIMDTNLDSVNYSLDGGTNQTLSSPFNVTTRVWDDGVHTLDVHASDLAGNLKIGHYSFIIDGTAPELILNTPANESVVKAGTVIDLGITEANMDTATYAINNGSPASLASPFDIDTTGWVDGVYLIDIEVLDLAGHLTVKMYNFTIDSTKPEIVLTSPDDNSMVQAGTVIDLEVTDNNTDVVNYTKDGSIAENLSMPYNINTTDWSDGEYSVTVNALDKAGNLATKNYKFTIDSTKPEIQKISPTETEFEPGTTIDLNISDANLDKVTYSINGVGVSNLSEPYDIETTDLTSGSYQLTVDAMDKAGNSKKFTFDFEITTPGQPPKVNKTTPKPNADGVGIGIEVIIEFDMAMDNVSVEGAVLIKPSVEIKSYSWDDDGTTLTIKFAKKLTADTEYNITISIGAKSALGQTLASKYSWTFTTEPDTDGDNVPDSADDDDDDDGIPDDWEINNQLDPFNPNDAGEDPDNDKLTNLQEYTIHTEPREADTDGDSLLDGDEVNTHKTNPLDKDTDGDNYFDNIEVDKGTDPNNDADYPDKDDKKDEPDSLFGLGKAGGIDIAVLLILAIIIIIVIILVALLKRKKPEEREYEEEEEEEPEDEEDEDEDEEEELEDDDEPEDKDEETDEELDEDELPDEDEEPVDEETMEDEELDDELPDEDEEPIDEDAEDELDELDEELDEMDDDELDELDEEELDEDEK